MLKHCFQYHQVVNARTKEVEQTTHYYPISLYAYCAGDPVNCVDPDGRDAQYIVNGNTRNNYSEPAADTHKENKPK